MTAGWLLPGGAFLCIGRRARFAFWFAMIVAAFGSGMAFEGGNLWPSTLDVQGLDGLNGLLAYTGALAKALAGGPYLLARLSSASPTLAASQLHPYGTTLLTIAGLLNLLSVADAFELRKAARP